MGITLIYFDRPPLGHTIKLNCIAFQNVDSEICSILVSYKRGWDYIPHHILCFVLCYILLTDEISWSDCLS